MHLQVVISEHKLDDTVPVSSIATSLPHYSDSTPRQPHIKSEGSSERQSEVLSDLNPDILLFLHKVPSGKIPGVTYDPRGGQVHITYGTLEQLRNSTMSFQSAYKNLECSERFVADSVKLPANVGKLEAKKVVDLLNSEHPWSALEYLEQSHAVRLVSLSVTEFDKLRKAVMTSLCTVPLRSHSATEASLPESLQVVLQLEGNCTLAAKIGDISKEEVDILVNSADSNLQLSGGLSACLNHMSGGQLQKLCNDFVKRHGVLKLGEVATTMLSGGGNNQLKCNTVIHAISPRNVHTQNVCKRALSRIVSSALSIANRERAASIAFPALGAGGYGVDKKLVAKTLVNSIVEFVKFERPSYLRDIRIVMIEWDTFGHFAQYIKAKEADS